MVRLPDEISQLKGEILTMQERLKALQEPSLKPDPAHFDLATDLLKAQREWQSQERDRQDEIAAIREVLPLSEAKLVKLETNYKELEGRVQKGFEALVTTAKDANALIERAAKAVEDLKALAKTQSELGHYYVYARSPLEYNPRLEFFMFYIREDVGFIAALRLEEYRKRERQSQ